jgi:protein SCO1/2
LTTIWRSSLLLLALLLAACGPEVPKFRSTDITGADFGKELALTGHDGKPRTLADFRGKAVVLFFGYTHCPDVCPTSLTDLRAGIRASGVDATVVFVTVDPARDDAAAMKQYVDYYAAAFIGLTGTETEIAEAAAAWGISYRRLESGSAAGYAMAHSAEAYLVDAEGTLRHHLFFGTPVELIAERLREVAGK